jgi:signal transduction histidine kinase
VPWLGNLIKRVKWLMSRNIDPGICERVTEKKESYRRYKFKHLEEEAFATFFDLAQEYTTLDCIYQICVAVPKKFFELESRLYVVSPKRSQLEMVCTSEEGLTPPEKRDELSVTLSETTYETEGTRVFPIRGNKALTQWIPFLGQSSILGMFEIYPKESVDARKQFFLEKFTNRIGYNLHQKMLSQQNIDHIKFINQLVTDIEHNVISPNMYYRLFLIRFRKNLATYVKIQQELRDLILFRQDQDSLLSSQLTEIFELLRQTNEKVEEEGKALAKHYQHTSLFLETLLRRDHFEKGTYVLRKQSCNFRTEIIEPLLDRYLPMFEKRGIVVDNRLGTVPDEEVTLLVDKGLISQVFDNLFSNAVKYTEEVEDQLGNKLRLVSYNRKILTGFFGEHTHGVRFNFFTTGRPLSDEEARRIFDEGYRAAASMEGDRQGSGHGLFFVKNVVEIHGGVVGCEPQKYGNLIFFTLPLKEENAK